MASPEDLEKLITEPLLKGLHQLAKRFTKDEEDARDAVQDILVELHEMEPEKRNKINDLVAFMVKMVTFAAIRYFKKRTRQKTIPLSPEAEPKPEKTDPHSKLHFDAIEKAVNRHRNKTDRLIFDLHFRKGLTDKEIALIIGETAVYVRDRIRKIRKWVRKYFKQ